MTDLSGIELRKELCLAIGWKWKRDQSFHFQTHKKIGKPWRFLVAPDSMLSTLQDADGTEEIVELLDNLPKYESDATLSEALLDKVCREKGWKWNISFIADGVYSCTIYDESREEFPDIDGATPSEARARCLLSALKADTR